MLSLKNILIWVCCALASVAVVLLWINNPLIALANGIAWGLLAITLCE